MGSVIYGKLDDYVYYGDSEKTIQRFKWFNSYPFQNKKQFCYVLESPIPEQTFGVLLMDIFPKIYDVKYELVNEDTINSYLITFTLHYDNFWDDVEERLFLYTMAFLKTMDFNIIKPDQHFFTSFADNFNVSIENRRYDINPDKFYDSGVANFLISLKKNRTIRYIPLWDCISGDIEAIKILFTFPEYFRTALATVSDNNCTTITQAIVDEYNLMRRTL